MQTLMPIPTPLSSISRTQYENLYNTVDFQGQMGAHLKKESHEYEQQAPYTNRQQANYLKDFGSQTNNSFRHIKSDRPVTTTNSAFHARHIFDQSTLYLLLFCFMILP